MASKIKGLILAAFTSAFGLMSFTSALDLRSMTNQTIRFFEDVFGPVFAAILGQYYTNEFLFAKILLLILLVMVISFILERSKLFGRKKGLIFLISIVISLLALRYLPENDLINGILLPYGVLGVALTTFLPFLIYFFFVHQSVPGGFGRRAAWAVYAVVFVVLLALRWNDISPASEWLYIVGAILVILAFIFDKTIHGYFALSEIEKMKRGIEQTTITNLLSEYKTALSVGRTEHAEKIAEKLKRYHYNV